MFMWLKADVAGVAPCNFRTVAMLQDHQASLRTQQDKCRNHGGSRMLALSWRVLLYGLFPVANSIRRPKIVVYGVQGVFPRPLSSSTLNSTLICL